MRRMRGAAGVSLRELETRGTWRRSTISQVENGKARPSRQLVEFCDDELGSDGLLVSIYAAARSRQLLAHGEDHCDGCGDGVQLINVDPPAGQLVNRGARLQARVSLRNVGSEPWRDRELRRMGAHSGLRLVDSARETRVPDTEPGDVADVVIDLRAPDVAGSVIGYWSMVGEPVENSAGDKPRECPQSCPPIAILLVVE
jgi:transcriptional regulator with XRE-family HTH domain